jgi:hypothetical protein
MTVPTIHEGAATKHREALHHADALGGIFRGGSLPNVHDRLGTNEVNDVIGRRGIVWRDRLAPCGVQRLRLSFSPHWKPSCLVVALLHVHHTYNREECGMVLLTS